MEKWNFLAFLAVAVPAAIVLLRRSNRRQNPRERAPRSAPDSWPAPSWSADPSGVGSPGGEPATAVPGIPDSIDDDVRFSLARPTQVFAGHVTSLTVFAHRSEPYVDPYRGPTDPEAEVDARVATLFGTQPVRRISMDASAPVARGARLRVQLVFPQLDWEPESAQLHWRGGIHEITFRAVVPGRAEGTFRGRIVVWCGPLIIAETNVALAVTASPGPAVAGPAADRAPFLPLRTTSEEITRYRKIFPSYAHADADIVQQFAMVQQAIGDRILQDVVSLRSGEIWSDRLLELIEEADVFQLFWSNRSMRSEYCRQEWEHALSLDRPSFIRPLYWGESIAKDESAGLPPESLRRLQFARVIGWSPPSPPTPPPSFGAPPNPWSDLPDVPDLPAPSREHDEPPMPVGIAPSQPSRPWRTWGFVILLVTSAVVVSLLAAAVVAVVIGVRLLSGN